MKRRDLLKGAAIVGASAGISLSLLKKDIRIGLTYGLVERVGFNLVNSNITLYPSFAEAAAAVKKGEVDAFISSSFFASNSIPELTLFGSFPTQFSAAQKYSFVNDNSELLNNLLGKNFGLSCKLAGVMSNEQIRFSNLSEEHLAVAANKSSNRLVTATSNARAIWFEDMGFKVHQHSWASCPFENLLFLTRHDLQLTESYSASAFLKSLQDNHSVGAADINLFKNLTVFKDDISYGPIPVEVFFDSKRPISTADFSDLKRTLNAFINEEAKLRRASLQVMKKDLELNVVELPASFKKALAKRTRAHLEVIAGHSDAGKAAVDKFIAYGGLLNV